MAPTDPGRQFISKRTKTAMQRPEVQAKLHAPRPRLVHWEELVHNPDFKRWLTEFIYARWQEFNAWTPLTKPSPNWPRPEDTPSSESPLVNDRPVWARKPIGDPQLDALMEAAVRETEAGYRSAESKMAPRKKFTLKRQS